MINDPRSGAIGPSIAPSVFADLTSPSGSERELAVVKRWAREWLGTSHPDLGRTGPVCPFIDVALKRDLLRVVFVRGNDLDHDSLVGLLTDIGAAFPVLSPADGPDSIYKAVLVAFPDLAEFTQIDAVQSQCKTGFVERGLMIGQFYPGHPQGGIHNPGFKPLDAPMPMLAVRNMVVSDYPFLCGNETWMAAHVARFARGRDSFAGSGVSGPCSHSVIGEERHPGCALFARSVCGRDTSRE